MVVELPHYAHHYQTFVLGSRVLLMTHPRRINSHEEDIPVLVYDFSRWGCRALVGDGKLERMQMPNPEEPWTPQGYNGQTVTARAVGDSIVSCGVSDLLEPLKHTGGLFLARGEWVVRR